MSAEKGHLHLRIADLIAVAAAGAQGKEVTLEVNDWATMFRLAHEHNVVPLLACALLHSPNQSCPDDMREYVLNVMRNISSANTIRKQRIFHLLNELEHEGYAVKLLKGYSAARHYAYPECRDSVDTDIWINPEQEADVCAYLEQKGFQIIERSLTSHHSICQHKRYGKIEVHAKLYDEIVEEVWFGGMDEKDFVREPFEVIETADGKFVTLGDTDQLLFLTLHMIKHFIEGGLSIRMMLDLALHYVKCKEHIDPTRYWNALKQLHYAELVSSVLWIMIKHGGFSETEFVGIAEYKQDSVELLLEDLMLGGYMGVREAAGHESGMEYNRQLLLKHKSRLQYRLYMFGWKIRSGYKYMFPSGKYMREKYAVLQKAPWLLPFAWPYQMISYPIEKIRRGVLKRDIRHSEEDLNEVAKRRVEMFKQLGMI